MTYIEGLQQEGILKIDDNGPPSASPPPEPGKPQDLGPKQVDMSRVPQRVVELRSVNWEMPE